MNSTKPPLHLYVADSSGTYGEEQMPENSFSAIGDALEAADRLWRRGSVTLPRSMTCSPW